MTKESNETTFSGLQTVAGKITPTGSAMINTMGQYQSGVKDITVSSSKKNKKTKKIYYVEYGEGRNSSPFSDTPVLTVSCEMQDDTESRTYTRMAVILSSDKDGFTVCVANDEGNNRSDVYLNFIAISNQ